jgi:phosphoenolpyruvate carboxykinase (ATP)
MVQKSPEGSLIVDTGAFTGRATKERFVCERPETKDQIHWGDANRPMPLDKVRTFGAKLEAHLEGPLTQRYRGFAGLHAVEVATSSEWHAAFCRNMFRAQAAAQPSSGAGAPIRVFHEPKLHPSRFLEGYTGDALIVLDPHERKVWIVGTAYAGEIKKGVFATCNFLLPELGHFPMHASANCAKDGSRSCVLFGLSGTGKTTLSADPDRALIGDDEIVWSKQGGLFNIEGGCYAKLIDLKQESEPEIWRAVHSPAAILENVVVKNGHVDFADRSKTENTRGSYPLSVLSNVFDQSRPADAPQTIVFLMADAFGVMPACARLDAEQAQYFFLSGYTAKVAGTELGVKEPKAAFSACFGAPFMPRHPKVYARLLAAFMAREGAQVWLLNTGWTEGGYGKGERFPIQVSRTLLAKIQSGELAKQPMRKHEVFGFAVPEACPGVDAKYLRVPIGPKVAELAALFEKNARSFA